MRVCLSQSHYEFCKRVQEQYPYLKISEDKRKERINYMLRASGKQLKDMIKDLDTRCIIKEPQIKVAYEYLEYINTKHIVDKKESLYRRICTLKKLDETSLSKDYKRLSIAYIAGLFDAEGSIQNRMKGLRVKITQKSNIEILQKICDYLQLPYKFDSSNWSINFYGKNGYVFLSIVDDLLIVKKNQSKQVLEELAYKFE